MTGVIVGVLLGLCLALALALYLAKSNPFVSRTSTPVSSRHEERSSAPGKPPAGLPVAPAKESQTSPGPVKPDEPRFGFYEMLPRANEATPQGAHPNTTVAARRVYYLQAGAFQNSADADNLKARLALAGLEAQIVTGAVGDRVWHRVRLGPFDSEGAMNDVQRALRENRIEAKVLKSTEQPVN